MSNIKKTALGRGLGALIEDAGDTNKQNSNLGSVNLIPVDKIKTNPYQPRTVFDDEALAELAVSIKNIGIIQPITVRILPDNSYQLISGERRLRAAKLADLESIPAYVRTADDQAMLEMALVENIQREDLDAIDVALSYQRLVDECSFTQEELSERVGKKRSTVANYIRLLKLPPEIQFGIKNKDISMGHARAIINIDDPETQLMVFNQIIRYDFTVRKVEEIVRELAEGIEKEQVVNEIKKKRFKTPEEYINLKAHLTKFFHTDVDFKMNQTGKGKIVIPFNSEEELERIVGIFDDLRGE